MVVIKRNDLAGCDFLLQGEAVFFLNLENLEAIGCDRFFAHEHWLPGGAIGVLQIRIHQYFTILR
ncbi:hypothetical protein APR50_29250 [Variovorax paradoxus]|nr:hypothetical protein APR52_37390 [Variovorax paradoxus]KPV01762.1 hypothetical protein APR50_29250 [Variovorax paradoxus]KPV04092.1 hypothetical protein APR49_25000 [Variovorax paradoxus]KPV17939.1 hypothetical protein APR51_25360 [Variovorax paradoxus]KPV27754.1 hypothetical protein APR48_27380 [Variovorax paradoxus]